MTWQIITFSTRIGLKRYKRLLFGFNSAAEVFQDAIRQVLPDKDEIIINKIMGSWKQNMEEHSRRLRLVLNALETAGLRVNSKKFVCGTTSLKFFGYVFSLEGITADPAKVEAVRKMTPPKDPSEVGSLLL